MSTEEEIKRAGDCGEKAGLWIAVKMQIAKVQLEKELGRLPTADELTERILDDRRNTTK